MSAAASPLPAEPPDPLARRWITAGGNLSLRSPLVMGILNVTPDSFSDGGELPSAEAALTRARQMVAEGAVRLDVGGESTRPGAGAIDAREELRRVLPVIQSLSAELDVPISVDTRKADVAREALASGATIVNDVSAMAFDSGMGEVVAGAGAGLVLMHMRGTPEDMRENARYEDVVGEVVGELGEAVDRARAEGIERDAIVIDPGIGFAKTASQSLEILGRLRGLEGLGFPILVGPSRKSFLGAVLDVPPAERMVGTVAACVIAYREGARIFRVHDVGPVVQALAVARAVDEGV